MNLRCLPFAAALVLASAAIGVAAQTAAPAASAAAKPVVTAAPSAPVAGKPPTRLMTPDESRETAVAPGELRPDLPVQRQISIPLGKTPPDSTHNSSLSTGKAKPGVDDAAVRCAAMADETDRALCRERAGKAPVKK